MVSKEPWIHGEAITGVREAHNLGVTMDSELCFEFFIVEVLVIAFIYHLRVLYRIREHLNKEFLFKYNHADRVYGTRLLCKTKVLIQRVQNACLRFCYPILPRSHVLSFLN